MKTFRGLYTAIVTPFTKEGLLDVEGLRLNIRHQLRGGVDGIVALGTTGEAATLSDDEKDTVITLCREEIPADKKLIIGTGSYSTAQTIANSVKAEKMGADASLIVAPYYNKPTQEGLFRHFTAVAAATPLPIIVYNVPGRSACNITTATLLRLASLPSIVGIKEASGDLQQISDIIGQIKSLNSPFSVFAGDDALTLPVMALGGDGVISVASNIIPEEVKALVGHIACHNLVEAQKQHFTLLPFFRSLFIETNPIPIKHIMDAAGMAAGPCRLPLCALSAESQAKLEEQLDLRKRGKNG